MPSRNIRSFIRPKQIEEFLVLHGLSKPGAAVGLMVIFLDLVSRQPPDKGVWTSDLVADFLTTFGGFYQDSRGRPMCHKKSATLALKAVNELIVGRRALESRSGFLFPSRALLNHFPGLDRQLAGDNISGQTGKTLPPRLN